MFSVLSIQDKDEDLNIVREKLRLPLFNYVKKKIGYLQNKRKQWMSDKKIRTPSKNMANLPK